MLIASTREVVNLINKYLFKEDIHRNIEEAPEQIRNFWKRATRQNASIDSFMAAIDLQSSIYGRIWVVVDSTMSGDVESVADEKKMLAPTPTGFHLSKCWMWQRRREYVVGVNCGSRS